MNFFLTARARAFGSESKTTRHWHHPVLYCMCLVFTLGLFEFSLAVHTRVFLGAYCARRDRFVNEYEEYKAASEEIAEKLRTEVQLLYEYTEKLTHVMERIECGM